MADEDLERLRRSLAMAPSLPADQARLVLDELERLRKSRRDLAADLDVLAGQVELARQRLAKG